MKYNILSLKPYPLGIRREGKDICASMVSSDKDCGIILYNNKKTKAGEEKTLKIPFPEKQHIGQVYSMKIEGVPASYDSYQLYQGSKVYVDEQGLYYKAFAYGTPLRDEQMVGRLDEKAFDWGNDEKPAHSFSDSVIYSLHVRGFTMHESSKCRNKGTFAGIKEKLDYLQKLGITSLLLMPAYEFIEKELLVAYQYDEKKAVLNYWGYKKGYYYAPKASYAAGKNPCVEFKQLVKACHEKGMELLMQFYFPDEVPEAEVVHILEHWVMEYHVDGFQVLANRGKTENARKSPILSECKWIVDEANQASKNVGVYRQDVMRDYRQFIKGDEGMIASVIEHLKKNGSKNSYVSSIADYHGLRLADVVSYNNKHNEVNGEKNTDGAEHNHSWNCGVEGITEDPRIQALRMQQMKNAMSLVLLGQSTPYLFMGDEMGSSQDGNNNPYNQDNEISWLDWECMTRNKELYDFTKNLLIYRKEHPFMHAKRILDGRDYLGYGYPNISFHGKEAYKIEYGLDCKEFAIMLCGENKDLTCKLIYMAFNMHWLNRKLALPRLKEGMEWQVRMTTSDKKKLCIEERHVEIPSRTIAVLEATIALPEKDSLKYITAF